MSARLLQLASPALPIGGYSYSGGLEWGIESGQVHDEASARQWVEDALALSLGGFEAPLMVAALRRLRAGPDAAQAALLEALAALNDVALAARETDELRQESTQMGYSLGQWVTTVCAGDDAGAALAERLAGWRPLSLPLAWALAAWRLGLDDRDAALAWLWSFAENQAMVLMKALPIGQAAAQRLLRALGPQLDAAAGRACTLDEARWSSAAPALALASMKHETQYSRLFRS
jgi:urease accessory protein